MKGYKGMDKDMKCRGLQYEIGKTYQINGRIELCKNGFHFCTKLNDVFNFYSKENGNRFFEVEANGTILTDDFDSKSVTSELTIIRELTPVEVNRSWYSGGFGDGYSYGNGCGYGVGSDYNDCYGGGNGDSSNMIYYDVYADGNGNGCYYGYGYADGNGNGCGYDRGHGIQKILNFR